MPESCGAEILVRNLKAQGVTHVFGVPGAKIDRVFDALDDEDVASAHVLVDFHEGLAIRERAHSGVTEGDADVFRDPPREFAMGGAGKNLQFVIAGGHAAECGGLASIGKIEGISTGK